MLLTLAAGVFSTYIDVENDLVLVETSLPSAHVQKLLEGTGKLVVFRGIGGAAGGDNVSDGHGAAVAIFRDGGINGLARLVQTSAECCVVEGTVDGLHPGLYQLQVRRYGDLSQGCLRYDGCVICFSEAVSSPVHVSCGEVLSLAGEVPAAGDLGTVQADSNGRAEFRLISRDLQVWNLIGRSLALQSNEAQRCRKYQYCLDVPSDNCCSLPPEMCVASLLVLLAFSKIPRGYVHVTVLLCGMKPGNLQFMLPFNIASHKHFKQDSCL